MWIRKGSKVWQSFINEVLAVNCQFFDGYNWSDLSAETVADGDLLKGMRLWQQSGNDGLVLKDSHGYKIKPKFQLLPVG